MSLPQQCQIPQTSAAVDSTPSHKPLPELLFLSLGLTLIRPGDVRHLVPDERGEHVIEHAGALILPASQGVSLRNEIDDILPDEDKRLNCPPLRVHPLQGAARIDDQDLPWLRGQQRKRPSDSGVVPLPFRLRPVHSSEAQHDDRPAESK